MAAHGRKLTLQEAAERLGVHYMTAYRYVRTGRLPGTRDGVHWWVDAADVESLRRGSARRRRGEGRAGATDDLVQRMVAGDEAGASPEEVVVEVVATALEHIGDDWEAGRLSVAAEHRASAVAGRLVSRLGPRFARRGSKRGTVVVGVVEGDTHGLPSAIVADVLRGRGYEVLDTGANTPPESFVETAQAANRLVAVLIGCTVDGRRGSLRRTVRQLRDADVGVPILVGGAGVSDASLAAALGADGWSGRDAREAAAAVEAVTGTSRGGPPPAA